jgi:hypothetical protein
VPTVLHGLSIVVAHHDGGREVFQVMTKKVIEWKFATKRGHWQKSRERKSPSRCVERRHGVE